MIDLYTKSIEGVWFGVACDNESVYATWFGPDEESTLRGLLGNIPFNASFQQLEKGSAFAEHVIGLLKDVYDGKQLSRTVSLAMDQLSKHNQKVLKTASLIPLGYVASYGAVAKAAGTNARSVGHVMALNPFAPIIPCHRVVGSDFSLVGYGGGLGAKLAFLKRERKGFTSKREIPVDSGKLEVFPVESVLKKVEKE